MAVFLYFSLGVNVVFLLFFALLTRQQQIRSAFHSKKTIKNILFSCLSGSLSRKYFKDKSLRSDINFHLSGIYQRRKSGFEVLSLPLNSIVFLGDSLIQTCEWAELMGNLRVKNRGIAGDTVKMILERLPQITQSQPSQLLLMVGINDLRHENCNPDMVIHQYKILLDKIQQTSPNTQLLVHSVLPINCEIFEQRFRRNGHHINSNVQRFNKELEALVDRRKAQYINLIPLLANSNGQLNPIYTVDGLHLSGKAYGIWGQYLKPFLSDKTQIYFLRYPK